MNDQFNYEELTIVLKKIRAKYEKLVTEFKKSRVLIDAFEDRYMSTLKDKQDLSTFLLAEIEDIEELFQKENDKREKEQQDKPEKPEEKQFLADKIFEENRQKILK